MNNRLTSGPFCDVLVIGGGPAGSTVSALLAEKGWRVVLCEKDHHPRFHIGESLLPMNLPILERLGVMEQVESIGVVKYGAEFGVHDRPGEHQTIYFGDALDKTYPYAFQVRRSEFDHILLQNSAAKGVDVREGVRVENIDLVPGGLSRVHTIDETGIQGILQTRFVVDASGRDTFLARKFDLKRKNPKHQSAAIFGHFKHVARRSDKDAGNISLYWFPYGWFWMIPLRNDVMSVGAVCWPEYLKTRKTDLETFFWKTIGLCPEVQQRMRRAILWEEVRATGNYSYRSTRMYDEGYLLVGDAFAFIDPVFSTGVYLAMNSAVLGAAAVDIYLHDSTSAKPAFQRFDRQVRHGIETVSWFIYRFTSPAMQRLFMAPRNVFRVKEALISMLAGDLFRKTPIGLPLNLFKLVYYMTFFANLSEARTAYRRRRHNVKLTFTGGTTSQDPQ